MRYKLLLMTMFGATVLTAQVQEKDSTKQRLDFAKTYFEVGGMYVPSFKGKQLMEDQISVFEHSATINPYLTWGAFHFWGHTEFYVTFPLSQLAFNKNNGKSHQFSHSVATGSRLYPWAVKQGKIRPYLGANWGSVEFSQVLEPNENQTKLSKDFMLNYDVGIIYNHNKIALRMGANYIPDNKWKYPLSKSRLTEISTPQMTFQLGFLYTFDATKDNTKENIDAWNSYPRVSKLSHDARKFGDFFIGAGPSLSFSLSNAQYNASQFPYLRQKLTSTNYFDLALGYHFNRQNLFTAISFRNPTFETEGFGSKQSIEKTSINLDLNKFLTDYSGFAPYIGLNIAYDRLNYEENIDGLKTQKSFTNEMEPGITFGWDIVPGKTNEALILRTNLRWFPFSKFNINGEKFNFDQLEYNLIQVVFYPDRLKKKSR